MQTNLIVRLCLFFSLMTLVICLVMVSLGASYPTHLIAAHIYSLTAKREKIALIDVSRGQSILLDLPVTINIPPLFSGDGRKALLPHQRTFYVWEMHSGRILELPEQFSACATINWAWLSDSRHISFQCRTNPQHPTIAGMYTFDTLTGEAYSLHPTPTVILSHQWSPNAQAVIISNAEGELFIVGRNGEGLQKISPDRHRFAFVSWMPDGESVLATGENTLEQYTFTTQSWRTLFVDIQTNERPILSPDGAWLAYRSSQDKKIYSLRLDEPSRFMVTTDNVLDDVVWLGWSPDSQWLMMRVAPIGNLREGNAYYLSRPNGTEVRQWARHLVNPPIWSTENTFASFYTFSPNRAITESQLFIISGNDYATSERITHNATLTQWSPSGIELAFVYYPELASIRRLGYYRQNNGVRFLTSRNESVGTFAFWR